MHTDYCGPNLPSPVNRRKAGKDRRASISRGNPHNDAGDGSHFSLPKRATAPDRSGRRRRVVPLYSYGSLQRALVVWRLFFSPRRFPLGDGRGRLRSRHRPKLAKTIIPCSTVDVYSHDGSTVAGQCYRNSPVVPEEPRVRRCVQRLGHKSIGEIRVKLLEELKCHYF